MTKTSLKISKFILKLLQILKNQQYSSIIRWAQNEAGVQIIILPQHFKLRKGTSFIRQLHLYGFSKKKSQQPNNIFEHQYFLKDYSENYHKICRKYKDKTALDKNQSGNSSQKHVSTEEQQKTLAQSHQWSSIQNIFWQKKQVQDSEDIFANWNINRDEEASFFIQNLLI